MPAPDGALWTAGTAGPGGSAGLVTWPPMRARGFRSVVSSHSLRIPSGFMEVNMPTTATKWP